MPSKTAPRWLRLVLIVAVLSDTFVESVEEGGDAVAVPFFEAVAVVR